MCSCCSRLRDFHPTQTKHCFDLFLPQIGDLKGHYHFRHDDVDELNKEHNRDKTDRLLLEKEVCKIKFKTYYCSYAFLETSCLSAQDIFIAQRL